MVFGRNKSNLLPVGLFDANYSSPGKKKRDKLRLASSGGGGGDYAGFGRLDDDDDTETERFAHSPAPNPNPRASVMDATTLTNSVQSASTSSYYTVSPLELQHLQEFGSLLDRHSLGYATTNTTTNTASTANQTNKNRHRHDKQSTKNVWNTNNNTTKTNSTAMGGPTQHKSPHQHDDDSIPESHQSPTSLKGILKSPFIPQTAVSPPKRRPPPSPTHPSVDEHDNHPEASQSRHPPPHSAMRRSVVSPEDRASASNSLVGRPSLDESAALPRRRPPARSTSQESVDIQRRPPSRSTSQERAEVQRRPPSRSCSQESAEVQRRPPARSTSQESVDVQRRPPSRSYSQESVGTQPQRRPRTDSDDVKLAGNTSRNSRSRNQIASAKDNSQPKRRPPRPSAFRGNNDEQSVVSHVSRMSFLGNPFSTLRGGSDAASPRRGRRPSTIGGYDDDDKAPEPGLYQPHCPSQPIKSWSSTFFPKSAPNMAATVPKKSSRPLPKAVQTASLQPRASPQRTFIKPPQPTTRHIKKPPRPPPKKPSLKLQADTRSNRRPSSTTSSSSLPPSKPMKRFVQPTTLEKQQESYPDEYSTHQTAPTPASPYLTLAHQCDTWNGMVTKLEMKCPERTTGQLDQFRLDHNHTQNNDDKDSEEEDSSVEMNRFGRRSNDVGLHISSVQDLSMSSEEDDSSQYSDPKNSDAVSIVVTDDDESIEVQRKIARMSSGQLRKWDGFRDQVTALVSQAMPDHLSQVSDLMQQFAGREAELVQTLQTVCQRLATIPKSGVAVHRSRGSIQCNEASARRTSTIVGRKIDAIASIAAASTLDDQMQTIKAEYILDEPKQPSRRGRQDEYDDDDDNDCSGSYSDESDDYDDDEYDDGEYDEDDSDDEYDDGEDEIPREEGCDEDDQYCDDEHDDEATDTHDEESQLHECDVEDHSEYDGEDRSEYDDEDRSEYDDEDRSSYEDEDHSEYTDEQEDDEVDVEAMHKAYQHRSEPLHATSSTPATRQRGVGRKPSTDWSFGGQSHQSDDISNSSLWK